ncbi:hypothetical protein AY599_17755 [Leptolyngbya valderiana BDU 20041]|nr:hypothetical protein AY599_17755 [Leptolyngbya valderiana BDU 20041]PPT05028.1 hypothetical protein CKA32_000061 [Geitlerinema sp. FC II]
MQVTSSPQQFAICLSAEPDSDLDPWKVYRILPDAKAESVGCLRVIDESGEDYLYPRDRFEILDLPAATQAKLLAIAAESMG